MKKRLLAVAMSLICILQLLPCNFTAFAAKNENLFVNGGFEDYTNNGWGARMMADFERYTEDPHSGEYCLRWKYDNPTESRLQEFRLVPGETYDFSMWGRLDPGMGEVGVVCWFYYASEYDPRLTYEQVYKTGEKNTGVIARMAGNVGTKWTEIKGSFTYTGEDYYGQKMDDNVQFAVYGSGRYSEGIYVYFDDFKLTPRGNVKEESERYSETFEWKENPLPKVKEYTEKDFEDVKGHWAETTIEALGSDGIVNGVSETKFAPDSNVTRAQFITLLTNNLDIRRENQKTKITDIKSKDWYYENIVLAENLGMIPAELIENGKLYPDKALTRGEAAGLLVKYAELFKAKAVNQAKTFTDSQGFGEYAGYIKKASEYGVINGYDDGSFKAQNTIKRAEAAEMIKNALELNGRRYFYVDGENGSDENDGTKNSPFKTVAYAQEQVRNYNKNMTGNIYVFIKAGEYYQSSPLKMTQADSGTNGYNIIYTSYGNGQASLTAGESKVYSWELHDKDKNIYKTLVGNANTRNMFVNGTRAIRAKSDEALLKTSFNKDRAYQMTTDSLWMGDLTNNGDIELSFAGSYYCNFRPYVKDIVKHDNYVDIQFYPDFMTYFRDGTLYFSDNLWVENAYELLDSEGEWYWNRADGYLYYKPRQWEDLSTAKITLPTHDKIIDADGVITDTVYEPITNITFNDIEFAYTTYFSEFERTKGKGLNQNSAMHRRLVNGSEKSGPDEIVGAAVDLTNIANVNLVDCTIKNIGNFGISQNGGIQNCSIKGNHFYDISGNAIQIGKPDGESDNESYPYDKRYYKANIDISENYIHDTAVEFLASGAIGIGNLQYSEIKNNEIFRTSYSGMHLGWGFSARANNLYMQTHVLNNYIHKTNLFKYKLFDGGAVYHMSTTYLDARDIQTDENRNKISYNYVEDLGGTVNSIYSDEGCSGLEISHNVFHTYKDFWTYGMFTTGNQSKYNIAKENYLAEDTLNVLGTLKAPFTEWYEETDGILDDTFQSHPQMNTTVGEHYLLDKDMSKWQQGAKDIVANAGITDEYIDKFPEEFQDYEIVYPEYGYIDPNLRWMEYVTPVFDIDSGDTLELEIKGKNRKGTEGNVSSDRVYIENMTPDIVEVLPDKSIKGLKQGKAELKVHVICGANKDVVDITPVTVYVEDELANWPGTENKQLYINNGGGTVKVLMAEPKPLTLTVQSLLGRRLDPLDYKITSLNEDIGIINEKGELQGVKDGEGKLKIEITWKGTKEKEVHELDFKVVTHELYSDFDKSQIIEVDDDFLNINNWTYLRTDLVYTKNQLEDGIQVASGQAVMYNKEKFNNKILHFKMKINTPSTSGWPSFSLSNQYTDKQLIDDYVFTFYPTCFEWQRFNEGKRSVLWGAGNSFDGTNPIYGGRPGGRFDYNVEHDVAIGSFDVENGIRTVLYVDGLKAFDQIDYIDNERFGLKDAPVIQGGGYFGIYMTDKTGYIELRKADEVKLND